MIADRSILPYRDTKAMGAADFYFGINATFRFIRDRLGMHALQRYWREMGSEYFRPVGVLWRDGGLKATAQYWREFFAAEPGAEVEITEDASRVVVTVRSCPAIHHLREKGGAVMAEYCQHCHFVSDAIGESAGLAARVHGGNGSCRQEFLARTNAAPQRLEDITVCQ